MNEAENDQVRININAPLAPPDNNTVVRNINNPNRFRINIINNTVPLITAIANVPNFSGQPQTLQAFF